MEIGDVGARQEKVKHLFDRGNDIVQIPLQPQRLGILHASLSVAACQQVADDGGGNHRAAEQKQHPEMPR